jgi:hypothetical protein
MPRVPVLLALCIGTVAATLVFPLASFAQTEVCKFTLLPSLEGGTGKGINHSDTIVGTYFPTGQAGFRGFIRESDGRVKTYQVPGSQSTYLTSINDKGRHRRRLQLPGGSAGIRVQTDGPEVYANQPPRGGHHGPKRY